MISSRLSAHPQPYNLNLFSKSPPISKRNNSTLMCALSFGSAFFFRSKANQMLNFGAINSLNQGIFVRQLTKTP